MPNLSSAVTLELATYLFAHCNRGVELASLMFKKEYVMEIVSEGKAFAYIPSQYKIFVTEDKNGKIKYADKTYSKSNKPTNIVLVSFKLEGKNINAKEINKIRLFSNVKIDPSFSNSFYLLPSNLSLTGSKIVLEEDIKPLVLHNGSKEERIYKFEFGV